MNTKKKWSSPIQDMEKKILADLGFLAETPVYHAYLFILKTSENSEQLEQRHRALPSNSRLLREEWLKLKELWRNYISCAADKFYQGELKAWMIDQLLAPIKEEVCYKWGLTSYYAGRIEERADPQLPKAIEKRHRFSTIASEFKRLANGAEHFKVKLFGAGIETLLSYNDAIGQMKIIFVFKEKKLTEEMAFNICQRLPGYYLTTAGMTVATSDGKRKSRHLNVTLCVEAVDLSKYLVARSRDGYQEITDQLQFCMTAAEAMRVGGIPAEGDIHLIINS